LAIVKLTVELDLTVLLLPTRYVLKPKTHYSAAFCRYTADHGISVESAGWGVRRRRARGPGGQYRDTCRTNQYGPSAFMECQPLIT